LPPVGWHKTAEHEPHKTTVCECENTVVMEKHPWHFTSMKKLFGPCTKRLSLCLEASRAAGGLSKSISCASCFVRIIIIKREGMGQYTDLCDFKKASMSIESPSILERDDAEDTRANPTAAAREEQEKFVFPRKRESKKKFCPLPFLGLSPSSPLVLCRAFSVQKKENEKQMSPSKTTRRDVTERPRTG